MKILSATIPKIPSVKQSAQSHSGDHHTVGGYHRRPSDLRQLRPINDGQHNIGGMAKENQFY